MQRCAKLEISFENRDGLEFKIIPESGVDKIKKVFGRLKEIEVGHSDFDDQFLIRGNDDNKIENLFSNPNIRVFMLNQRRLSLELTSNSLILRIYTPIGSIDHLKLIYDGLSEILNELCIMDSGYA